MRIFYNIEKGHSVCKKTKLSLKYYLQFFCKELVWIVEIIRIHGFLTIGKLVQLGHLPRLLTSESCLPYENY